MRKAKAQRADSGHPINLPALTVTFPRGIVPYLFMFEITVLHPIIGDGPITIFNPYGYNGNFREAPECTLTFSRGTSMAQFMFGSSLFYLKALLPPNIQTQAWHLFVRFRNPSTGGHKLPKTEHWLSAASSLCGEEF